MKNIFVLLLLLLPFCIRAQIINTVAGTGVAGFFGDGGLATAAKLKEPARVAFDKFGNYYIADGSNQRIRKVNITTGDITTIAGNGTAGYNCDGCLADTSELNYPAGIAVDTNLNVYVADQFNHRVRIISQTTGIISTYAGIGVAGYSGDSGLATAAKIELPEGVCLDKNGNLYFTDGDSRIRKVSTSGIINTVAGNGIYGYSSDGGLADTTMIDGPTGVAIDDTGNLYFSEFEDNRIRKISVAGYISTIAGYGVYGSLHDSGIATEAQLMNPYDVAIDHYNNIYIAGYNSQTVLMVNSFGVINIVAGNGYGAGASGAYCCDGHPADSAELWNPEGVAADSCDNLYIADASNNRVRKVNFDSTKLMLNITASNDTVCAGTAVSYSVTNVTGGAALTYHWYVNGAATSGTGTIYTYAPANGDAVWCVCTSINPCYGSHTAISDTIYMVVQPTTTPTITVNAPVSAMLGSIVTVTATVAGAGSSYSIMWYDDGAWFATTSVPTTTYTKIHDIDTITATVASTSVGCWDSSMSNVRLVGDTSLGTPPQPSPKGREVLLYPNPASGVITITSAEDITSVEVRNVYGQVVTSALRTITSPLPPSKGEYRVDMDISMLPVGVYILCITQQPTLNPSEEGNIVMRQVVKE